MFRQQRATRKPLGKTNTRLPVYYTAEKSNHVSKSDMKGGRTLAPATSAARQNKHAPPHVKNVAFAIPESSVKSVDSKMKKRIPTRKKAEVITATAVAVPSFSSLSTLPLKSSLPTQAPASDDVPPPTTAKEMLTWVPAENVVKVEVPASILTAIETQTNLYLVGNKLATKLDLATELPDTNCTELWTEPGSQVESSVQSASSCKSLADERHQSLCSAVGSDGDHQKPPGLILLSTSKRKLIIAIEFCLLFALGGILAIGMIPYFESAVHSYLANRCSCLDPQNRLLLDASFSSEQQGGLRAGGLFHWSKCPLLADLSLGLPSKNK